MSRFELRRGATRGVQTTAWLDARFSLAFGDYDDPARRRFGPLLALNEDRVQPGTGFPMHGHAELEILMLPRSGTIEHHDSQGRHLFARPGEWLWMRAGRGLRHRQWNPSPSEVDHHFQIWFEPRVTGRPPHVVQGGFEAPAPGTWCPLVAPGGLDIDVDVELWLGAAAADRELALAAQPGRARYLHLMRGTLEVADGAAQRLARLHEGDAIVFFDDAPALRLHAAAPCELLRFDMAAVDPANGRTRDLVSQTEPKEPT